MVFVIFMKKVIHKKSIKYKNLPLTKLPEIVLYFTSAFGAMGAWRMRVKFLSYWY